MLDTIGAIVGPLTAFWLLGVFDHHYPRLFAVTLVPGLLATGFIIFLVAEKRRAPIPHISYSLKTRLTTLLTALCATLVLTPLGAGEAKKERIEVTVQIPDTPEALWSQIDKEAKALAELVAAGKKDEVYAMAETVEALVNALPEKYPDLAADKKKRVVGQVKNTARVLDDLHDSMDAGKTDEATKELEQIQTALAIIRHQLGT